jgi:hypothetical protein
MMIIHERLTCSTFGTLFVPYQRHGKSFRELGIVQQIVSRAIVLDRCAPRRVRA